MEIKTKDVQEISVVTVAGRIDASTAPELEKVLLTELILSGKTNVVINFGGVEYISSGGLRVLLGAAKEMKAKNGILRFCYLNPNVYKIFKLAGFTTIFNIYETEEEALKEI